MATPRALLVTEASARVYRRVWRGSVISTFLNPVLYLASIGLGVGSLIDPATLGGVEFLPFLATGMLAGVAMQTGAGEGSYPVMAGIKWVKDMHAVVATPVGVAQLVRGLAGWWVIRIGFSAVVFAGVMVAFGAVSPGAGLLTVLPAVLTGVAFAAPVAAWTATLEEDVHLTTLFRFVVMPLFLFSGTFFPITQLPDWMEAIAFLSPLWHGVELTRGAAGLLGSPAWPWWLHASLLAGLAVAGTRWASRTFARRLNK